ncbi:hypothetical protein KUV50_06950 [Membranicola marinus]|uniref:Uncharacterized protein n=1 Tax=Membranihabitans marinus TaxID=1227546 RepID=A0A953HT05_9BACT|nr:hypothetical protein [Membranihabitans marinus]MBY5957860.1 hypothetical protein [Membranihabitans marinus]
MVFNYFYTIVFLVSVLLFLNIINRILFMRFVKRLPATQAGLKVNDLLDQKTFANLIGKLNSQEQEKAIKTRSWLIRIIVAMFVVIVLIIIVGILSYIA